MARRWPFLVMVSQKNTLWGRCFITSTSLDYFNQTGSDTSQYQIIWSVSPPPQKCRFCNFHAVFGHFAQNAPPPSPPSVDPTWETLISLPVFLSRSSLKLHIVSVAPTMVKYVIEKLDWSKASGPDCIPKCETNLSYVLAELFD